jgi:hypothetical protein
MLLLGPIVLLLALAFPTAGFASVLYSQAGPYLINDNGAGTNLAGMSLARDDTSTDTLYFRYIVEPISDYQTEAYFAALQLFEGNAERLGVGNAFGAFAYSAFNTASGDLDLDSSNPESGASYQLVRSTDVTTLVFKVAYAASGVDAVTVWLDPDPAQAEGSQATSLTTAFTADASFDEIRLREGISGPAGADGWTFRDIRIATTFAEAVFPDLTSDSDGDGISDGVEIASAAWRLPRRPTRSIPTATMTWPATAVSPIRSTDSALELWRTSTATAS